MAGGTGSVLYFAVSYLLKVLQFHSQTGIHPLLDRNARTVYPERAHTHTHTHTEKYPRYSKKQAVWVSEFRSLIGQCVSRGTGCVREVWTTAARAHPPPSSLWFTRCYRRRCVRVSCAHCSRSMLRAQARKVCTELVLVLDVELFGVRTLCAFWVCNVWLRLVFWKTKWPLFRFNSGLGLCQS